jgi:hypothetical protein
MISMRSLSVVTGATALAVVSANRVCALGRKLYPSIVFGPNQDPDTMDYAGGRLVAEIGAIIVPPPNRSAHRLAGDGREAAEAWRSLARRPPGTVPFVGRRHAARTAAHYGDDLVSLGEGTCQALRPKSV